MALLLHSVALPTGQRCDVVAILLDFACSLSFVRWSPLVIWLREKCNVDEYRNTQKKSLEIAQFLGSIFSPGSEMRNFEETENKNVFF